MHARYYSPFLGRFLSVDPARPKPQFPQSFNKYAYVQGLVLTAVDPTGRKLRQEFVNWESLSQFLSELEHATGLDLEVKNGFVAITGAITDSTGKQIGSPTARELLSLIIETPLVFTVKETPGDSNVDAGGVDPRKPQVIMLDFQDIALFKPGRVPQAALNSAMIFFHELGHAAADWEDPKSWSRFQSGMAVDLVNKIRRELGLPERLFYNSREDKRGEYLLFDLDGRWEKFYVLPPEN